MPDRIQFDANGATLSIGEPTLNNEIGAHQTADRARVENVRVTDTRSQRVIIGAHPGADPSVYNLIERSGHTHVQLVDPGNSTEVAGYRTSPEAAAVLAKQAPHLVKDGSNANDSPEKLASLTSPAPSSAQTSEPAKVDDSAASADEFAIENPIGAEVVKEFANVGVGHQAAVIVAAMKGDQQRLDVAVGRLAAVTGDEPGLAAGKVSIAMDSLAKQVEKLCIKHGADFNEFSSWAQRFKSDTTASVMLRHLQSGNVRAWEPLITQHVLSTGGNRRPAK